MIEAREAVIIRHINTSLTIERARRLRQVLLRGLGLLHLLDIEVRDFIINSLALALLKDVLRKVQWTTVFTTADTGILMVALEK